MSSFFFYLAWPPLPVAGLIMLVFVPILSIHNDVGFRRWIVAVLITLFAWNLATTFWLYNTIPFGACAVHILNSMMFTLPFILFWFAKKRTHLGLAYATFIFAWISLEYLHLNWELGFPFLNLGNGLSMYPQVFQWYEFTGTLGGTLWILILNVVLTELFTTWRRKSHFASRKVIAVVLIVFIPTLYSIVRYNTYIENSTTSSIEIISPSIDCYSEKYQMDLDWCNR